MKAVAHLRDKRNGNQRHYEFDWDDSDLELLEYIWLDGNEACDCNRSIKLYGEDSPLECDCSSDFIELVSLTLDGNHVTKDGD